MAYNREQILAALALANPTLSSYLDLQTGAVVQVDDTSSAPEAAALRDQVMESYGDRYRYISGGNAAASDTDVDAWLKAEGL